MGDRANIAVKQGSSKVFLYAHWAGYDLPEILRQALSREQRWDDGQYLSRIVFCEMLRGDVKGETGFGISSTIGDNSYPVIVVDCDQQKVFLEPEADGSHAPKGEARTYSFEEYVALPEAKWSDLDSGRETEN